MPTGGIMPTLAASQQRERLITLQPKAAAGGRSWSFVGVGRTQPFLRGPEVAEVLDMIG